MKSKLFQNAIFLTKSDTLIYGSDIEEKFDLNTGLITDKKLSHSIVKSIFHPQSGLAFSLVEAICLSVVCQFFKEVLPENASSVLFKKLRSHDLLELQEMMLFTEISANRKNMKSLSAEEYLHYKLYRTTKKDEKWKFYYNALCLELMHVKSLPSILTEKEIHSSSICAIMAKQHIALPSIQNLLPKIMLLKETKKIIKDVFYGNNANIIKLCENIITTEIQLDHFTQLLNFMGKLFLEVGLHDKNVIIPSQHEKSISHTLKNRLEDSPHAYHPRLFQFCYQSESYWHQELDVLMTMQALERVRLVNFKVYPLPIVSMKEPIDFCFSPVAEYNRKKSS